MIALTIQNALTIFSQLSLRITKERVFYVISFVCQGISYVSGLHIQARQKTWYTSFINNFIYSVSYLLMNLAQILIGHKLIDIKSK